MICSYSLQDKKYVDLLLLSLPEEGRSQTPIPSIEIRPQLYDAYYGTTPRCQSSSPSLPANTDDRVSEACCFNAVGYRRVILR